MGSKQRAAGVGLSQFHIHSGLESIMQSCSCWRWWWEQCIACFSLHNRPFGSMPMLASPLLASSAFVFGSGLIAKSCHRVLLCLFAHPFTCPPACPACLQLRWRSCVWLHVPFRVCCSASVRHVRAGAGGPSAMASAADLSRRCCRHPYRSWQCCSHTCLIGRGGMHDP